MDLNQEIPCLSWWEKADDIKKEVFKEAVNLVYSISLARPGLDQDKDALVFNNIYRPIFLSDGIIPVNMEFTQLCRKLRVNPHEISENTRLIFETLSGQIGSIEAAQILWLPPREVRRLIAVKKLSATKDAKGHWRIETIAALELAAKRLGLRVH